VLFDALLSNLQSADADPVSIQEVLSCLSGGDSSLLTRAMDARTALGDAAWLKMLTATDLAGLSDTSVDSIRDCVTPLILDETTNSAVLLDAFYVFYRLVSPYGNDAIKAKQRFMIDIPDIDVHLIRLLHHPASDRVQIMALNTLGRAFELIPGLARKCLRDRVINYGNFGHFCSKSMIGESDHAIYGIVDCIKRESTIQPYYVDLLPIVMSILYATDDANLPWLQQQAVVIIARCVAEVGRPAELLLLQANFIPRLIWWVGSALVPFDFKFGFSPTLPGCDILAAVMKSDIDDHGDDSATLHPWIVQLVESKRGLTRLEGTQHACMDSPLTIDGHDGRMACCSPASCFDSSRPDVSVGLVEGVEDVIEDPPDYQQRLKVAAFLKRHVYGRSHRITFSQLTQRQWRQYPLPYDRADRYIHVPTPDWFAECVANLQRQVDEAAAAAALAVALDEESNGEDDE
jgi:hypothetical protein